MSPLAQMVKLETWPEEEAAESIIGESAGICIALRFTEHFSVCFSHLAVCGQDTRCFRGDGGEA